MTPYFLNKQVNRLNMTLPLVLASAFAVSSSVQASLYTTSIGNLVPGYVANDDNSFDKINLGFSVNYFGTIYNSFFVNNNGNVTFGSGTDEYDPSPLNTQTTQPMIAPYWTDLDTRDSPYADSGVYLTQTANQTIVTWKNMGYFDKNYTGVATFQMVLNNPATVLNQQVIGFFYDELTFGADEYPVTVGFGDGLGKINSGEVSYAAGENVLVAAQLNQSSVWFDLENGTPVVVPNVPLPGAFWLFLSGLLGLLGLKRQYKI